MKRLRSVYDLWIANPIFCRWVDQIILSASVVVLFLAFKEPALVLGNWWSSYTSHWSAVLRYSAIFLITALAAFALTRLGAVHAAFRFDRMRRYPPVWLTALVTAFVLWIGHTYDVACWNGESLPDLSFTLVALCTGVLFAFACDEASTRRRSQYEASVRRVIRSGPLAKNPDEDILAWILNERPIHYPEDDRFGHRLPAQRIASLLSQPTCSSIGIVGPLGSGKSSLINLVVHYLSNPNEMPSRQQRAGFPADVITCKVDGWGRTSGTVAQKILSLAIEEVKKHVDCLSIVNLPENYRRAIGGTNSSAGAVIAALLHPSHDPISQLAELDNILSAADLRLVIFLEDLDRNVGDEIIGDEMPALLDRLRMLKQVSFVLAIGSDRLFSDVLIRICDHIEAVA